MKRNDFGLWGLELSPEEFARAMAALGVFEGAGEGLPASVDAIWQQLSTVAATSEGLLRWSLKREQLEKLAQLKMPGSALAFAQAWEKFRTSDNRPLRFELHLDRAEDYFWIAEQMLGSAIGATSLYVRVDEPQTAVGWNWPLRIGFLDEEDSQRLRKQLETTLKPASLKKLVEFVTLTSEGDDCDLLLFPQTLQGALSELLKAAWHPKADCVLVLGGSKDLSARMSSLLSAVRSQARTSGVGLLFIPAERRGEWLSNLIKELSRNNAIDVALFDANRSVKSQTALLAASRRLIDLTLISRTAARIGMALKRSANAVQQAAPSESTIIPPPGPTPTTRPGGTVRGSKGSAKGGAKGATKSKPGGVHESSGGFESMTPPPPSPRPTPPSGGGTKKNGGGGLSSAARNEALAVAAELSAPIAAGGGAFESVSAAPPPIDTSAMMANTRKAQSIIKKISAKPVDRWIQAQVFDSPGETQQREALKPATSYAVDVRIGPHDDAWERATEVFNVEDLPPSETGHNLTVIFTEPRVSPDPQVGKIFLPPEDASAPCRFYFHTGESLDPIKARITVLHRNRVIQTAILNAPVAANGKAKKGDSITVEIEARVLPTISDLNRRQTFDAALVLNHTEDGTASAMTTSGEQASMFSFDDAALKKTIDLLNSQLTKLALDSEFPEDISKNPTTTLLNKLARHGRMLHLNLFKFRQEGDWPLGPDKKKIQVVSTRLDSNLPLEFLYDYDAPKEDAKLCGFAKKSLPKGVCDKACEGARNNKDVVCPLGFWGLNRIIERHSFDKNLRLSNGTYALKPASSSERKPLEVLGSALFAASDRVDQGENKGTIKSVEKALKETTKKVAYAKGWDDWTKKIKSQSPSLLILLSHTEEAMEDEGDEMRSLEISKDDRLSVVDITEEYIVKPGSQMRPLVMLVGCSTHAPDNPLENFVTPFSQYASIVVSTGATVLAVQAAKVAIEFIRTLAQLSGKPGGTTFGEVMQDARRRLLAKGLPMVLCLEAYGDADWYLK